jgi:MFS family permease
VSTAEPTAAVVQTRWGIIAIVILAGIVGAMQVGKVPPAIPVISADLNIERVTAGWVISIFLAASAVLGPLCGVVGDRIGHRRFLLWGLAGMAGGSLLGGWAPDATTLLLARLFEGFGFLATVIAAPSIIVSITAERDLRMALGAWGTYMPAGIALMMLLAPALLASLGWRGLWFANAALLAVFLLLFAALTRGIGGASAGGTSLGDVRLALSRLGPWLLAGCFAAFACQFIGVISWLPTFFMEDMGHGGAAAAAIVAFIVALNALGNIIGGWLLRSVRRSTLIAVTSGCLGIIAVIMFWRDMPEGIVIVLAAIYSLIGGFIPAAALTGVPLYAPSPAQIGATNGIVVQGANFGSLIGPPALAAAVTLLGGWSLSAWFLLAMGIIGIVLALMLRATES